MYLKKALKTRIFENICYDHEQLEFIWVFLTSKEVKSGEISHSLKIFVSNNFLSHLLI